MILDVTVTPSNCVCLRYIAFAHFVNETGGIPKDLNLWWNKCIPNDLDLDHRPWKLFQFFPLVWLLAIELAVLFQMCDLHLKFEEDRTKTAVAIESDRYSLGETYTSSDFCLCPMPWIALDRQQHETKHEVFHHKSILDRALDSRTLVVELSMVSGWNWKAMTGHMMINKMSSTFQVVRHLDCLSNCTVSPICDSYNYRPSDKTCQLNTHDTQHTGSGLVLVTKRASSTHTTLRLSLTRPTMSSTAPGSGAAPRSPLSLESHQTKWQWFLHRLVLMLHRYNGKNILSNNKRDRIMFITHLVTHLVWPHQ